MLYVEQCACKALHAGVSPAWHSLPSNALHFAARHTDQAFSTLLFTKGQCQRRWYDATRPTQSSYALLELADTNGSAQDDTRDDVRA